MFALAVRGDAGGHVPDTVLSQHAQKVSQHADLLFFCGVYRVAQRGERARRRDIAEESAVELGVFVEADEFAAAFRGALCLGALVEGAEAVVDKVGARGGAAVERAVERAVSAARHDEGVAFGGPLVCGGEQLAHGDGISRAELGKELFLVYLCSASAHSVDDDKTIFHGVVFNIRQTGEKLNLFARVAPERGGRLLLCAIASLSCAEGEDRTDFLRERAAAARNLRRALQKTGGAYII